MALSMQEKNSEYYFGGWRRSICICSALNDLPEWAADWVVGEGEKDSPPTSMKGNGLHCQRRYRCWWHCSNIFKISHSIPVRTVQVTGIDGCYPSRRSLVSNRNGDGYSNHLHVPSSSSSTGTVRSPRFKLRGQFLARINKVNYILSIQNSRNELKLDHMQCVRPIWYELLHNGIDRIESFRGLPPGLSSHHWVVITNWRSAKM